MDEMYRLNNDVLNNFPFPFKKRTLSIVQFILYKSMIMKTSYLSKFCLCRSNAVIVSCLSVQVTPGPARPRHGTGPGCREKIA